MSITHAIMGFLSWRPLTGYDLKKLVAGSEFLPWSGNSNQIYTTLVRLRRDGLVTVRTEQQENLPPRKIYELTAGGLDQLRSWVLSTPDLPETRSAFLLQLAWADQLEAPELERLVGAYEQAVEAQLMMGREKIRRGPASPDRTARETYLWMMAHENRLRAWESELTWARDLRKGLGEFAAGTRTGPHRAPGRAVSRALRTGRRSLMAATWRSVPALHRRPIRAEAPCAAWKSADRQLLPAPRRANEPRPLQDVPSRPSMRGLGLPGPYGRLAGEAPPSRRVLCGNWFIPRRQTTAWAR